MSNAAAGGAAAQAQSEKEIINKFQGMIQRQRTTVQKLAELDAERMEYRFVHVRLDYRRSLVSELRADQPMQPCRVDIETNGRR